MLEGWREAWARDSNRALERCGHEERIDHRTLEAQRVEAQERATAAHDRGDEAEALRQTVRAVELDRDPLPQLSAGAWQMKERGIEVAAVRVWREVKAQAAEVARVAEVLAGQVRDWIGRAVDRPGRRRRVWPMPALRIGMAGKGGRTWPRGCARLGKPARAAPCPMPWLHLVKSRSQNLPAAWPSGYGRRRRGSTGERWPRPQRGCRKAGRPRNASGCRRPNA